MCLVDLLLLVGLGLLNDPLLLTFGLVDLGVALSLRGQHHCALFALGAHLLLHGVDHVTRWVDIPDLVAQHLHAPGIRGFVKFRDHVGVDRAALFEGAIQIDATDLAAQGGLRKLRDGKLVVGNAIGGALGVQNLQVEDPVDPDLHVVLGNAHLLGDVDRQFLQAVFVGRPLDKGQQDVKSGAQRAAVLAEILHHVGALLRHDDRRLGQHQHDQHGDGHGDKETHTFKHGCGHPVLRAGWNRSELSSVPRRDRYAPAYRRPAPWRRD